MLKNKKITYKQVKEIQTADLKSKTSRYMLYRKFSTPFTYAFVKLNMSAPTVSIINFFTPVVGYFLLSKGSYFFMVLGLLFFVLFKILDCSDGEVARVLNPRAMEGSQKNIEGVYFDAVGHFIFPIGLGMGLGIGLYNLYDNSFYITIGFVLSILLTLEVAVTTELIRSYLRKGIIERKMNKDLSDKAVVDSLLKKINGGRSWSDGNFFSRLFGVYPFQGLVFSGEFIVLVLILFMLTEYFLSSYIPITAFNNMISILSVYLYAVIFVKVLKIFRFIYRMKKYKYISSFLNELKKSK